MKVILLRKLKNVGDCGDIKNVADGYAINFLFPQKIAEPATEANINKLNRKKEEIINNAEEGLIEAEKMAERLNGVVVEITGKCNEDGKLYASISPNTIVRKLKEKNISIIVDQIILMEPIKDLGEHSVFIKLDHNLEAEITVIINQ